MPASRKKASAPGKKKVGIAYMGGGAMGSAEAGFRKALKELLPGLKVHAISGISTGSVNACLEATGNIENMERYWLDTAGADSQRLTTELFQFWELILRSGINFIIHGNKPFDTATAKKVDAVSAKLSNFLQGVTDKLNLHPLLNVEESLLKKLFSYYGLYDPAMFSMLRLVDINPAVFSNFGRADSIFDIRPMVDKLDDYVDYNKIKRSKIKLFIGTSKLELKDGALAISPFVIDNKKISKEWVQCSGTILVASKLMKKDGSHFIDGGYTSNPLFTPLIRSGCDVILVAVLAPPRHLNLDDLNLADALMTSMVLQSSAVVDRSLKITNLVNELVPDREFDKIADFLGHPKGRTNYRTVEVRPMVLHVKHSSVDFRLSSIRDNIALGYDTFVQCYKNSCDFFDQLA